MNEVCEVCGRDDFPLDTCELCGRRYCPICESIFRYEACDECDNEETRRKNR